MADLFCVYWEWIDGPHKGARFWGCHAVENDGRLRDWPAQGLRAIGASRATVIEGEGLDLLPSATAGTTATSAAGHHPGSSDPAESGPEPHIMQTDGGSR